MPSGVRDQRTRSCITTELDVELILDAERTLGSLVDQQDLKKDLRAGFWAELKRVGETLG